MKLLPTLGSQMSGSLSGISAGANRGGHFLRSRTWGSSPATPLQRQVRQTVSTVAQAWSSMLNQTQRNGWSQYGKTNPIKDELGNVIILSGFNVFSRVNITVQLATQGAMWNLTAPGAVPLMQPLIIPQGNGAYGRGQMNTTFTWPNPIQANDVFAVYVTKPVNGLATAQHAAERAWIVAQVNPAYIGMTVYGLLVANPWQGQAAGSSFRVRVFWIRNGNLSITAYKTGNYI